jgi:hypothetical protein
MAVSMPVKTRRTEILCRIEDINLAHATLDVSGGPKIDMNLAVSVMGKDAMEIIFGGGLPCSLVGKLVRLVIEDEPAPGRICPGPEKWPDRASEEKGTAKPNPFARHQAIRWINLSDEPAPLSPEPTGPIEPTQEGSGYMSRPKLL